MQKTAVALLLTLTVLVGCGQFETHFPDGGTVVDAEPLVYPYDVRVDCSQPTPTVQLPGDPVAVDWSVTNVGLDEIEAARVSVEVEWTGGIWTEEAAADVGPLMVGDTADGRLLMIVPSWVASPGDPIEYHPIRCHVVSTPSDQHPGNDISTESGGSPLQLGVHGGF